MSAWVVVEQGRVDVPEGCDAASSYTRLEYVMRERASEKVLRAAIRCLPDVSVERDLAYPTVTEATVAFSPEGLKLLLEAGAELRPEQASGPPALVGLAISPEPFERGRAERIVSILLAHGDDPCWPGAEGETAYELAVSSGRQELADVLDASGANCS